MKYIFTFLSIFLLALSINVFAQEAVLENEITIEELESIEQEMQNSPNVISEEEMVNIISCNNTFSGKIEIDLLPHSLDSVSGTTLITQGEMRNISDTAISNATLYIKVFREDEDFDLNMVDHFIAQDNLTIPANSSIPLSFDWNIPSTAPTGNYKIAAFVYVDDQFDVAGITTGNASFGGFSDFYVLGESEGEISFDLNGIKVNNQEYIFSFSPVIVSELEDVLISVPVKNSTLEDKNVTFEWKVYKNNPKNEDNLINTIKSDATVLVGEIYDAELSISENEFSNYYVIGEMKSDDSESIIEIHYVRNGLSSINVLNSQIASYPIISGTNNSIESCVYNAGNSIARDQKIVLELQDKRGKVVESYEYFGLITNGPMLLKKDFKSRKDLSEFSLHTKIYKDDFVVNEEVVNYSCDTSNQTECKESLFDTVWYVIGGFVVIILLLLLKVKIHKNKNIVLPLVLLFIGFGLLLPASTEAAKTTTVSSGSNSVSTPYAYQWWARSTITTASLSATYSADVRNADTNAVIAPGSNVEVGTRLKFKKSNSNISFNASSPMAVGGGYWRSGASRPPACQGGSSNLIEIYRSSSNAYSQGFTAIHTAREHITASINPPDGTITKIGNMSCIDEDENTMICTVDGVGAIGATFRFSSTYGKLYRSMYHNYINITNGVNGCANESEFSPQLNLGAATITYNLNAIPVPPPNNPPNPPVITGPTNGNPTVQNNFGFTGTDPDNNKVRYGIDWDNNGTVDQWAPASGTVNSGTLRNGTKSWPNIGVKNFKALTEDEHGLRSGWTSYSITIVSLPVNGSCGTTNNSCTGGTLVNSTDTPTNYLWQCNGSNGGTNASCSLPIPVVVNGMCSTTANQCLAGTVANQTTNASQYLWRCNGSNGGTNASCSAPRTVTGPFSVSCSATSVQPGQQANFTANTQNASGAVTYQWKESNGTNILGANSSTFSRTYTSMGSYLLNIFATSSGVGANNFCNVTVACDGTHSEGEVKTSCTNNIEEIWTCSSSGWSTTQRSCVSENEPISTFGFDPGIVNSASGRCRLDMEAENVSSCRLIKNGSTFATVPSINSFLVGTSISINGSVSIPIGRYTLECTGTGENPITKTFGVKSCILNPDIMEY